MPIKDKSAYPKDWKQISQRIRQRAENKCEFCGIQNHIEIIRSDIPGDDSYIVFDEESCGYLDAWNGDPIRMSEIPSEYSGKHVRIVLTVAHLNHDTTDNSDTNLKALCQRCHNRHDGKMRAGHAKETRRKKRAVAQLETDTTNGQTRMF